MTAELMQNKIIFNAVVTDFLLNILPVCVVFPVAARQPTLRTSVVQSNSAWLPGRFAVGFAFWTIVPRIFGKSAYCMQPL